MGAVGSEPAMPVQPLRLRPLLSGIALFSDEAGRVPILAPLGPAPALALGTRVPPPDP